MNKSFLVLFFKKELLPFLSSVQHGSLVRGFSYRVRFQGDRFQRILNGHERAVQVQGGGFFRQQAQAVQDAVCAGGAGLVVEGHGSNSPWSNKLLHAHRQPILTKL